MKFYTVKYYGSIYQLHCEMKTPHTKNKNNDDVDYAQEIIRGKKHKEG